MTESTYLGHKIISYGLNTHHVFKPDNPKSHSTYFADFTAECISGARNWIREQALKQENI